MAKNKLIVLVVVDPTASAHPSIERAAWFARREPAQIELFISDYSPQLAQSRSGGTAEDVLDRLHCDLVIVKPEGFKAVLSG